MFSFLTTVLILIVPIFIFLHRRQRRWRANPLNLPTPPGPKPIPIIGNILDLPKRNESATYHKWAQKYGQIMSVNVLGRPMIFVNSAKVASDLFDKRSANYSDRPRLTMINELMGWDWTLAMMPYGERWRQHRKCFHQQFQSSVAPTFWPAQLRETHALLRRILDKPQDLVGNLRHYAASSIMSVSYGIEVAESGDRYVDVAEEALLTVSKASAPGAFLVDMIPILKYVPEWVPGAGFQRKAREWKKLSHEMRDAPFNETKRALTNGTAKQSFVSTLLEGLAFEAKGDPSSTENGDTSSTLSVEQQEEIIKDCAGVAYAAGNDSMVSTLHSIFLAMILHPSVQTKAQAELDALLRHNGNNTKMKSGISGRLPEFSDRASLPYVEAVVKEVLRWSPVAPLGLPHMVTNDDTYNGYFIPGGALIVGFAWEILHDESTYPDPHTFKPERFLHTADHAPAPDPALAAFGFGRRICPGRHMADASLWITIACILSVFDIRPTLDPISGEPEKVVPEFTSGMICHPLPFRYCITPRSADAARLINETADSIS